MLKKLLCNLIVVSAITAAFSTHSAQAKSNKPKTPVNSQVIKEQTLLKGIKADVMGIATAVEEYYRDANLTFEPKPESWSGACSFWEITKLELTSLKGNEAKVKSNYIERFYSLIGDKSIPNPPEKWGYRYELMRDSVAPRNRTHDLRLEKKNGRWIVTGR